MVTLLLFFQVLKSKVDVILRLNHVFNVLVTVRKGNQHIFVMTININLMA